MVFIPISYNYYDVAQQSLVKGSSSFSPPEIMISLWWYSGTSTSTSSTGTNISKGYLNSSAGNASPSYLHTLNSNWPISQKYSFEVSLYSSSSSLTMYAKLWDFTTNSEVSTSQVTTTSTTMTVIRSGQFTLIPGHTYGVMYGVISSGYCYLTDASLIVFPS